MDSFRGGDVNGARSPWLSANWRARVRSSCISTPETRPYRPEWAYSTARTLSGASN